MANFYTIGHSNRSIEAFLSLLTHAGAALVIDVRMNQAAVCGADGIITYPAAQGRLL